MHTFDMLLLCNVLTVLGGVTNVAATFPMLKRQLLNPYKGTPEEIRSRILMVFGNVLLIPGGIVTGLYGLSGLAAVNAILLLFVWWKLSHPLHLAK